MSQEQSPKGLTRRGFIGATVGAGAGATMLMAFGVKEAKAFAAPKKWDKEVGVLIVGTGAAGLSAAIEAKKAGADVLILEKMPFMGGNTGVSTAAMNAVQSSIQKEKGVADWSIDEFYEWTMRGGDFKNNPGQVKVFAQESPNGVEFLRSLGAPFPLVTRRAMEITDRWGAGLVEILAKGVAQLKVPIMTETKVTALVADVSGVPKKVLGVVVKDKRGKTLTIRAKKALILANGGFGANPVLVERYDPSLKGFATTNIPGAATGECTMMALSLGADTDCINYIQIHPTVYAFEGKRSLISETLRENGGAMLVNSDGERFVDEEQRRDVVAQTILKQKGKIAYLIISKETYHKKTDDYVKDGLVVRADSLEELAGKINVDPARLKATAAKYSGYVEAKNDPDFKRGLYRELGKTQHLPGKIATAPFFAIKVTPGIHHCCGGLRINASAQVLDAIDGSPVIQKLYAAGEAAGGTHGTNRMGGNAIPNCIIFGRIAGKNAAAEKEG
jgi:fumarate reductase flavoprotein subunit